MRRYAFIISILGIFILFIILLNQKPIPISSPEQVKELKNNQLIILTGEVVKESQNKYSKTLTLDKSIQLICENPCPSFLKKNISVIAKYESYFEQLKILKIKEN